MFNLKKKEYVIIPLGFNCMPRTVLTRHGLKPHKWQGELTYPFDLAFFFIPEITKYLQNDFADFFENWELKQDKNQSFWIKPPFQIKFFHDKIISKEKLIKRYKKRIENFYKQMKDSTPILFVQILTEEQSIDIVYNELKRLRENRPFKYIVIDTLDVLKGTENPVIDVLKMPYPSEEYRNNWWLRKHYKSADGKKFEKDFCDFCKKGIKELLNSCKSF